MSERRDPSPPEILYERIAEHTARIRKLVADLRWQLGRGGSRGLIANRESSEEMRRIAQHALNELETTADVLDGYNDCFKEVVGRVVRTDWRYLVMSKHGHRRMVEINKRKVLQPDELFRVEVLYRELKPQIFKKVALYAAIAERANMPARRVRTAVEKLQKQGRV